MTDLKDVQKRMNILQSGFRNFVGGVKIPISADSKWLLEVVCLNSQPEPLTQAASLFDQAKSYLEGFLWNHQARINKNKQEWIASMKS
ncbi:MAG: hypothetical protein WCK98_01375 [bacterium]